MTHPKSNPSETVKSAASDVAETAKTKADAAVADVTDNAAEHVESQARNMREAASAFDDNPYAKQAAEQVSATLSQVADAVRTADLASLQTDVTDFARRNPALFFGGAALLGFVAARAMKASERSEIDSIAANRHDYPSVPDGQRAYPDQNARRWGYS